MAKANPAQKTDAPVKEPEKDVKANKKNARRVEKVGNSTITTY